jgi:hypothetical protein
MLALTTVGLALSASARATDAGAPRPPTAAPACIGIKTDSRYVPYGYNHVVILTNGCARAASCTVSTDVNPEPRSADLAAGQVADVTTFIGSPSATFTAKITCSLRER